MSLSWETRKSLWSNNNCFVKFKFQNVSIPVMFPIILLLYYKIESMTPENLFQTNSFVYLYIFQWVRLTFKNFRSTYFSCHVDLWLSKNLNSSKLFSFVQSIGLHVCLGQYFIVHLLRNVILQWPTRANRSFEVTLAFPS